MKKTIKYICGGIFFIFILMIIVSVISSNNHDTTSINDDNDNYTENHTRNPILNNFKVPSSFTKGELDGVWTFNTYDDKTNNLNEHGLIVDDFDKNYDDCVSYLTNDGTYSVHKTDIKNIYYGRDIYDCVTYFEVVKINGHKLFISCDDDYDAKYTPSLSESLGYLCEFNKLNNLKPINLNIG